jgi:hypothetical protein
MTSGFSGLGCPPATPGAKQFVYFANLTEIDTWTAGATGIYSNFTMDAGTSLYKFEVSKDTMIYRESLQGGDQDLGSYNQEVEFMLKSMGIAARNAVDGINGPDIVAFVPTKNGEILIMGKDIGGKMITNDASTNQDEFGETVIIQATQMPNKRYHLLDTDVDTTIALLESKVIAS